MPEDPGLPQALYDEAHPGEEPVPPEPVDVSEYTRSVNVLDREELEKHEQAVNEATFLLFRCHRSRRYSTITPTSGSLNGAKPGEIPSHSAISSSPPLPSEAGFPLIPDSILNSRSCKSNILKFASFNAACNSSVLIQCSNPG